jgi:hypothetical protein
VVKNSTQQFGSCKTRVFLEWCVSESVLVCCPQLVAVGTSGSPPRPVSVAKMYTTTTTTKSTVVHHPDGRVTRTHTTTTRTEPRPQQAPPPLAVHPSVVGPAVVVAAEEPAPTAPIAGPGEPMPLSCTEWSFACSFPIASVGGVGALSWHRRNDVSSRLDVM